MLRKGCKGCPQYSHKVNRCLLGYVNPKTIKDGVSAARIGLLRPCPYTEKGHKVIERVRAERTQALQDDAG